MFDGEHIWYLNIDYMTIKVLSLVTLGLILYVYIPYIYISYIYSRTTDKVKFFSPSREELILSFTSVSR